MHKFQLRKPILAAMGACAAMGFSPGIVLADNAQDIQQLKDQVRHRQKKIDDLSSSQAAPAKASKTCPSDSLTSAGITIYGTGHIDVDYVYHRAPLSHQCSPS